MIQMSMVARRRAAMLAGIVALGAGLAVAAVQAADAPVKLSPAAEHAVDARQAVYSLIGFNFKPLGDVVKGGAPYDAADVQKRIARLGMLADHLDEVFPDLSNVGEPASKAKAEIWTNHVDFDKRVKDFQAHIATLAQVNATDKAATDGLKAAVLAVAQDCKTCHETYRAK